MKIRYKTIFLTILHLACFLSVRAQSADVNYVKTEVFTSPEGMNNLINIDYLDKKGRVSQHLDNGNGNGNFLRTYYEYNKEGMLGKESSPMDSHNDVSYKKSYDLSQESQESYDDKFAYTTLTYDGLGRLASTQGPGFDWYDDDWGVLSTYLSNKENSVKCYSVSERDGSLVDNGVFYKKGSLKCQQIRDEDWHYTETYVDELGRKIMERSLGKDNHDTYYVYDKLNRLRYVLTPEYQKTPDIFLYAYQYSYDAKNRLISKTLPGCCKTTLEYDSKDRLVLMQDAPLRRKGMYRFFMYDALGRLCIQGTCTQATLIQETNDVVLEALRDGIAHTGYVCLGNCVIQNLELEEVCYYDDYTFLTRNLFYNAGISQKLACKELVSDGNMTIALGRGSVCSKGLLTGKFQVSSSGASLCNAYYYDNRARLVESISSYGTDKLLTIAYDLNYIGQPQRSLAILGYKNQTHSFASTNTYHPTTGKRLESVLSVDGQQNQVVSKLEHDKLGRIISQAQGKSNTCYRYNVRSWLRGIQSPGLDEELMYTYYEVNEGYNYHTGNLATMEFSLPNSPERHHVEYSYDRLGRLADSKFYINEEGYIPTDWNYGVLIPSYDLNGNITKLVRKGRKDDGTFGLIDDLELKYMGNQLMSVEDNAEDVFRQGSTDFKDNSSGSVEYTFDENGNMLDDTNKGISFIEYDRQNFPRRILMYDGHQVEYDYTPSGGKLRTVYQLLSPEPFSAYNLKVESLASSSVIDSDTIEYLGNFILRNGEIDKILFTGGFATMNDGTAKYHYFTQDQQGNVRAVFDENGNVEQYLTYDALGNIIPELSSNVDFQPYAFNGKELDRTFGLNLHDFGFRSYDSVLGRWTGMDRKCEEYASATPYAFCMSIFVNGMDPFGLDYWSTSNPETIRLFMEDIKQHKRPGDSYKNFELHATDSEFLSNLTYNDEKGEYYVNFGRIENGEVTCVGLTLRTGMAVASQVLRTIEVLQKINIGLFGVGNSVSVQNELFDFASSLQTGNSYLKMHTMSHRDLTSLNTRAFGSGTSKFINMSKSAGKILGWGSVGISVFDFGSYLANGGTNTNVYIKDIADFAVGILSIYGGPIGLGIGIGYTLTMMYLESSGTINLERTY